MKNLKAYRVFFSRAFATEKSCKKDAAERVLLCFYAFERQEVLRALRAPSFVFFVVTSFSVGRGLLTVDFLFVLIREQKYLSTLTAHQQVLPAVVVPVHQEGSGGAVHGDALIIDLDQAGGD